MTWTEMRLTESSHPGKRIPRCFQEGVLAEFSELQTVGMNGKFGLWWWVVGVRIVWFIVPYFKKWKKERRRSFVFVYRLWSIPCFGPVIGSGGAWAVLRGWEVGLLPWVTVTMLTLQPEHGSTGSSDCHGPSAHQVQPFSLGSYCTSQHLMCGSSFQSGNWGDCHDHWIWGSRLSDATPSSFFLNFIKILFRDFSFWQYYKRPVRDSKKAHFYCPFFFFF